MRRLPIIIAALVPVLLCGGCGRPAEGEARFTRFAYAGRDARFDRSIDPLNEYFNPVLSGFRPDPSICRKGEDYFLVNSSFTFYPSIPIYHSRDLVHWQQLGHVLDRPSQMPLDSLRFNRGIYAPDISYNPHNDTFYVVNTCVDGGENFVVKCRDPFAGGWSDPILLPEVEGIDPSLFFDDDGRAYLLHNGMPEGERQWKSHRALWMREYDTEADRVKGERRLLLDGGIDFAARPEWLEGPHLYKHDGEYILIAAEGGTYEAHAEVALRADCVTGPYRPCDRNPILTQRDLPADRPDKVTSTGHADLICTPGGEWYALFLGCRPYAEDYYNTGRETFLLPVAWEEGTPVILPPGEAVPTGIGRTGPRRPPRNGQLRLGGRLLRGARPAVAHDPHPARRVVPHGLPGIDAPRQRPPHRPDGQSGLHRLPPAAHRLHGLDRAALHARRGAVCRHGSLPERTPPPALRQSAERR